MHGKRGFNPLSRWVHKKAHREGNRITEKLVEKVSSGAHKGQKGSYQFQGDSFPWSPAEEERIGKMKRYMW